MSAWLSCRLAAETPTASPVRPAPRGAGAATGRLCRLTTRPVTAPPNRIQLITNHTQHEISATRIGPGTDSACTGTQMCTTQPLRHDARRTDDRLDIDPRTTSKPGRSGRGRAVYRSPVATYDTSDLSRATISFPLWTTRRQQARTFRAIESERRQHEHSRPGDFTPVRPTQNDRTCGNRTPLTAQIRNSARQIDSEARHSRVEYPKVQHRHHRTIRRRRDRIHHWTTDRWLRRRTKQTVWTAQAPTMRIHTQVSMPVVVQTQWHRGARTIFAGRSPVWGDRGGS